MERLQHRAVAAEHDGEIGLAVPDLDAVRLGDALEPRGGVRRMAEDRDPADAFRRR
jgi:hypothetical protein